MDYLSQKVTFWIATFSLIAFVSGNLVGQHGVHVFLSSILAGTDDSLLTYDGTVSPIPRIPDPVKWAQKYGGDFRQHTYQQAPEDVLIKVPAYVPFEKRSSSDVAANRIYSVDYYGTYEHGGGHGSHHGIDMAAPSGTPVVAVMNGLVAKVSEDAGGFGQYVMIKHKAPDPENPSKLIIMYSVYAHLSSQLTTEGMYVQKGDAIGTVGKTGNASGYHLHFAMERGDAPSHPYWPFTWSDTKDARMTYSQAIDKGLKREEGLKYSINPMLYVQANYSAVDTRVVTASSSSRPRKVVLTKNDRLQNRLAKLASDMTRVAVLDRAQIQSASSSSAAASSTAPAFVLEYTPPAAPFSSSSSSSSSYVPPASNGTVTTMEIHAPQEFTERTWQKVRIVLLDDKGSVVTSPSLAQDIYLRTAFGSADFRPAVLSALDFKNGVAEVEMLPRGEKTVVIELKPQSILSKPIRFAGK